MQTLQNQTPSDTQAAPAEPEDYGRKCGSCGRKVPHDFEEGQGESLPCGH